MEGKSGRTSISIRSTGKTKRAWYSYETSRRKGSDTFDITRQSRLFPSFDEDDQEEFFLQFEKTATSLSWPIKYWRVLIQTDLAGRERSAYL